jgi:hypothetical protein
MREIKEAAFINPLTSVAEIVFEQFISPVRSGVSEIG